MGSQSVSDQLRYVGQWFRTWSDYQKDDFLHILAKQLSPTSGKVNGIIDGVAAIDISTSGRPPTLFACQMKLFNEWWASWAEEERGKLTEELKTDTKFWEDLQSEMDGSRAKDFDDFFAVGEGFEATVAPTTTSSDEQIVTQIQSIPEATPVDATTEVVDTSNGDDVIVESNTAGGSESAGIGKFKTTIEVTDDVSNTTVE